MSNKNDSAERNNKTIAKLAYLIAAAQEVHRTEVSDPTVRRLIKRRKVLQDNCTKINFSLGPTKVAG